MINVTVQRDVPVPARSAWALLADFGNFSWAPGLEKVEVSGAGVGMVRRIFMSGAPPIEERLEALEHDTMRLEYTIPDGFAMPVSNYRAQAQVVATGRDQCRIDWSCSAQEDGVSPQEADAIVTGFYEQLLDWIGAELCRGC
jgi:hypothetical protein